MSGAIAKTNDPEAPKPWERLDGESALERDIRRLRAQYERSHGTLLDRIADKFEITDDGCWLWTGSINTNGYGQVNIVSPRVVHRALYEAVVGILPDDLDLDHLCRQRSCINPDHLDPVSRGENLRRGHESRPERTHCRNQHVLTADNRVYTRGGRFTCRTCSLEAKRRYRRRKAGV